MNNELIKYKIDDAVINRSKLDDLSGTFGDIGQLIAYMRDLTRTLVPLSNNLNDFIENLPSKVDNFLDKNKPLLFAGVLGCILVGGYLGTGIVKNILEIKGEIKKYE